VIQNALVPEDEIQAIDFFEIQAVQKKMKIGVSTNKVQDELHRLKTAQNFAQVMIKYIHLIDFHFRKALHVNFQNFNVCFTE
jgi:phosphoribosylformimino-5-aminoimidazole carboxamide ribonucleotide (ProFAR) isomerase